MKKVTRVIASVLILTMLLGNYAPMLQTVYAANLEEEQKQELLDTFNSLIKDLPVFDDFIYSDISDEWVSIKKYIGSEKTIVVPDKINGKSVVSVSQDAFMNNEEIECVIIPSSIVSIGNDVFTGCKNLNKIVICGTSVQLGVTMAGQCENLESIYVSSESDSSQLEAVLSSDLGEEKAKEIDIIPCDNVNDVVILFADPKDIPKSDNVEVSDSDEDEFESEAEVTTSSQDALIDTTASDEMTYEIVAPSDIELPQENDEPELQLQTETDDTEQSVTSEISEQNTEPEKTDEEGKNVKAPVRSVQSYLDDFVIEDGVLVQYTGNGGIVEIPEGVTKIGETVFSNNYDITGIVIPEGVTEIGNWAFSYCGNLSCTLNLPDTLKIIGERAFCSCGITGTLTIPDGVTTIGEGAFEECGNLTGDIIVPGSVTSIGSWAFGNISEIIVFEGLTPPSVAENFAGWNYLEAVYVPDETYDEYVSALSPKLDDLDDSIDIFRISERIVRPSDIFDIEDHILVKYNGSDETVVIPDGVEHIGRRAFQNNKTVKSVVFPQGLKSIGDYAFQNCPTLTGDLVIPDGVESIGRNAFYFCEGLDGTLSLPNGLISIGKWAFLCCRNLHGNLTIPNSVTSIGEDAFCACGFSGKLFLPNNSFSFGDYAFAASPFKYIYFSSLTPPSVNEHTFEYMPGLIAIYVPDEVYDEYCEAFSGYLADDIQVRKRSSESVPTGDFVIIDGVLEEYVGNGGVVEIPDGVTSIGRGVFYQNKTITGVVFPQNLHSIGARAFQDCSSMTGDLIIPDSVTQIGEYAFAGCEGLNGNLVISKGITAIADGVFQNCSFSGNLTIPDGVVSIGNYAFQSCWALGGTITLPDGLKSLGCWAFSNCVSLSGSLTVPEGVEYVGECAIVNTGITSIVFEGISVPVFGDDGFKWDESLRRIYVPDESYESYLSALNGIISSSIVIKKKSEIGVSFSTDEFDVTDGVLVKYKGNGGIVEIPDGVTDIYDYVFCCNSEITGIVFPSGLQTIGQGAFERCERLSGNLTLPDSLTRIGSSSFWGCSSLRGTLIIPENIEFVGQGAFNYSGLTSLVFESKDVPQFEEKAFYWNDSLKRIYVPDEAYDAYSVALRGKISGSIKIKRRSEMGLTSDTNGFIIEDGVLVEYIGEGGIIEIPEGVTDIANKVFCSNASVTGVVFPEGLVSIGESAFAASGLSGQLTLPSSLKIIGYSAFQDCSGLTGDLLVPNGVTKIRGSAFENCSGFNGVLSIPDSVKSIEYSAFDRCSGFTGDLVIPDSVTSLGAYAFYGCSGFNGTLSISNSLTRIEVATFNGCRNLTGDLVIPDSVTEMGESAFEFCSGFNGNLVISRGLTSINGWTFVNCSGFSCNLIIPYNVTSIGYSAFSGCSGFKGELVLPAAVNTIDGFAFNGCSGFTGRLVIPDSVKQIGKSAFQQCSGLTGVDFPEGIESIEDYTFNLCEGLTGDLIIPESVKTIGKRAFAGCRGLNGNLVIPDSITNLGNDAFYSCENVMEIVFRSKVPASLSNSTVFEDMVGLTKVTVPSSSYQAYIEAYSGSFPDSVSIVTDVVYSKVTGLAETQSLSGTVAISWDECTDEDVVGYVIYRNGNEVGRTGECTFVDRQLESNREYSYAVTGYDNNGFETEAVEISVSTSPFSIYSLSTNADDDMLYNNDGGCYNVITAVANDYDRIIYSSQVDENSGSAKLYYLNNNERVLIGECLLSDCENAEGKAFYHFEWENIDDLQDGVYTIVFCLTDIDGISTEMYKTVKIANHRPQTIINVMATGDVNSILLSWSMSSEVDTNTYCIYRQVDDGDFERIARLYDSRYTLNYVDTDVEPEKKYSYYVTGESRYGIEGKPSLIAVAYLGTDEEKPVVTKMTPANNSFIKGNTTITVTGQDNVGISHLTVSYSDDEGETWSSVGEFENKPYASVLDTTSLSDGKILIKAHAVDLAGNESDPLIYAFFVDNTGPEKVTGLSFISTSVTATLSWNDVADDDIGYFRVEKKDTATGNYSKVTDVTKTLGTNIYGLIPDTSYIYRVVGYDIHGNRGTPSDDITVRTLDDKTDPVITQINPKPGYYSHKIPLSITATDDNNIKTITVQTSTDRRNWTDSYTQTFTGNVSKSRTVSYTLPVDVFEEGNLFVRAIATDAVDNESDSSIDAPFVQYIVDRTMPAVPAGVSVQGNNGYIEVWWNDSSENDISSYSVYRSLTENGEYTLLKNSIEALNYFDRTAQDDITYFYKVSVKDRAGNESGLSHAVSAKVSEDTEPPTIPALYPISESKLGAGYDKISVAAFDNRKLSSIKVEYRIGVLGFYNDLYEKTDIGSYHWNNIIELPMDEFDDGNTVYLRVTAIDASGNKSINDSTSYVIDKTAPTVGDVSAEYFSEGKVHISWNGNNEDDLIGYRIYRKLQNSGDYEMIAQCQSTSGKTEYLYDDVSFSTANSTFVYKVEAVDSCGNISGVETNPVEVPDRTNPTPVLSCDSVMEVGVEYLFDASESSDNSAIISYRIDFGDGTFSSSRKAVHCYTECGNYVASLTVIDDMGNESTCSIDITVRDRTLLGTTKIHVVSSSGESLSKVAVYFDLGEENQTTKFTDTNGYVEFTSKVGKHIVGCFIPDNNWLPAKKDIIVYAGETPTETITLIRHTMIEGSFSISRMSFEEIKAAGIDVSKPENQHIVEIKTSLVYSDKPIPYTFAYNETTNKVIAKPLITGGSCFTPHVIKFPTLPSEPSSNNYSIALIEVPISASILKEFFRVNVHVINNASSEFYMYNNRVSLHVPEGLTIVKDESDSNVIIHGQTSHTFSWVVRGDKKGTYNLSADYSGTLSQFDMSVSTTFKSQEPITVYGLDAISISMDANTKFTNGNLHFKLSMTNTGKTVVNCPQIDVADHYIRVVKREYRKKQFEFSETEPELQLVGASLRNSSGYFTIFQDKTYVPESLAEGETFTRSYVIKGVTEYFDLDYLGRLAVTTSNESGVSFSVRFATVNEDSAEQIMESIKSDPDRQAAYESLMNDDNYIYSIQATLDGQDWLKKLGETFYNTSDLLFNFDTSVLTNEREKEAIRKIVVGMLQDGDFETKVEHNIKNKYIKIIDSLFRELKEECFGAGSANTTDGVALFDFLTNTDNARNVADSLLASESDSDSNTPDFFSRLLLNSIAAAAGQGASNYLKNHADSDKIPLMLSKIARHEYDNLFNGITDVTTTLSNASDAWNNSWYVHSQFLVLEAGQEETKTILMNLKNGNSNSIVSVEINNLYENMLYGFQSQTTMFVNDFLKLQGQYAARELFEEQILKKYPKAYIIYKALKAMFNIGDSLVNGEGKVNALVELRTAGSMTSSLKENVISNYSADDADDFLSSVDSLIRLRLTGEHAFVDLTKKLNQEHQALEQINARFPDHQFESIDDYYNYVKQTLDDYRNTLFANASFYYGIPDPIEVSIDYQNECIQPALPSIYEYSINGKGWNTCNGSFINLNPKNNVTYNMWFRVKESSSNFAGNISSVIVPTRPSIGAPDSVRYKNGVYYITGLYNKYNGYLYDFGSGTTSGSLVVKGGNAEIACDTYYPVIYLQIPANNDHFRSDRISVAVERPLNLTINCAQEGCTVSGAGQYFFGEKATLSAVPADGCTFLGWYLNGELLSKSLTYEYYVKKNCSVTASFSAPHVCADHVTNWTVDNNATYVSDGQKHGTCNICGNTVSTSIPTLVDDYGWQLDNDKQVLKGLSEQTFIEDVIAHYRNLGYEVTVTDADGNEPDMIGTGCVVNVDGKNYNIVVNGDVTGDGEIDVFDLFAMTDHLNDEEELTGVYFIAACYLGNEEFDLFDLFAVQAHINQD